MMAKKDEKQKNCELCKKVHNATHYCVECGKVFCETAADIHSSIPSSADHNVIPIDEMPSKVIPPRCEIHNSLLEFFCMDHSVLICYKCQVLEHSGHVCKDVKSAFELRQNAIKDLVKDVEVEAKKIEAGLSQIKNEAKSLTDNLKKANADVNNYFDKLENLLKVQRQYYLNFINKEAKQRQEILSSQRSSLSTHHQQLISSTQQIQQVLPTKHQAHLLQLFSTLPQLIKQQNQLQLIPKVKAILAFKPNNTLLSTMEKVESFGVVRSKTTSVQHCEVEEKGYKGMTATKGEFKLTVCDEDGKVWKEGGDEVKLEIETDNKSPLKRREIDIKHSEGVYMVKYDIAVDEKVKKVILKLFINGDIVNGFPKEICITKWVIMSFAEQSGGLIVSNQNKTVKGDVSHRWILGDYKMKQSGIYTWRLRLDSANNCTPWLLVAVTKSIPDSEGSYSHATSYGPAGRGNQIYRGGECKNDIPWQWELNDVIECVLNLHQHTYTVSRVGKNVSIEFPLPPLSSEEDGWRMHINLHHDVQVTLLD